MSVSSLSFSSLLVQYCHYDTPGVGAAERLPGGKCVLPAEARSVPPKFDLGYCLFFLALLGLQALLIQFERFLHPLRGESGLWLSEVRLWCELGIKVCLTSLPLSPSLSLSLSVLVSFISVPLCAGL